MGLANDAEVAVSGSGKRGTTVRWALIGLLIVALLGAIASRFFNRGSTIYFVCRAFFFVGIAVWAWLELAEGVNLFRRVLGAAALAWTVYMLQDDLSGGA